MRRMQGLVLAGLSLALTLAAAAETASQVFQQVSPSVVVVVTYDAAGKPAELGSGVMLPNHDVATNCHVLKDGTQYRVRYRDKDYTAQLDKSDWDRDVCSLTVPGLPAPPVVLGDTKTLQVGAPVYAIGTPEGLQLTLSEGIVSSLRPVGGGSYIQTTAVISPGSSGGGLFDDQGRLLGLTSFYMAKGQQLNFALPVEWIEALPQRSTQRIAEGPSEVDWLNRAVVLETKKDWRGLVRWSQAWIKASPKNEVAWAGLGEAYDDVGQHAEAIDAYRQALQINPQDADAWNNLGVAYDDAGQHAEAIAAYRHGLEINPQDAMIWDNLGHTYFLSGLHAQAITAFRDGLQVDPRDADIWFNLGVVYQRDGQSAEATNAFHQVSRIDPNSGADWLYGLGMYDYYVIAEYPQAIDALREAIRIKPQDANAWYILGLAYYGAGQTSQAFTAYQRLKTLSPELAQKLFDTIVPK